MVVTIHEMRVPLVSRSKGKKKQCGPKINPESASQVAKRLGIDPGTYRNRLRRVAKGKMTLEEAQTKPVMGLHEISSLGGRAPKSKG